VIAQTVPPILILAGGRATRLKNLSVDTPKYLMPVDAEHTFADVHLTWLASLGFKEIILSVGYLADSIKKYCLDGSKWKLNIQYLEDGPQLVGTGGAVRNSLTFKYQELCVTYGDTLLSFDLNNLLSQYRSSGCRGAMTIYKNTVVGHICNAQPDGSYVIYDKINPRPDWQYIDYGFMVLQRSLIESFPQQSPLDLSVPLSLASHQKQIMGYPVKERFWEIGSPEALAEFQAKFHS